MAKWLWLGMGITAAAAIAATGAFGSSGVTLNPATRSIPDVSGRCSKATALKVATQLQLGVDPTLTRPIAQVLCGAFVGPGSNAMAASIAIPSCGRTAQWAVFRWTGTEWQLMLTRNNGADLDAVGSDIRETQFVLRPGDAHCFPTGGTRSRTWHWDGNRFTATPWKLTKPAGAKVTARTGYFKTPSGNIVCGYGYGGKDPAYVGCRIWSRLKSPPTRRGPRCSDSAGVFLRATGRTTTERSICPGEPEGDAGVFVYKDIARVLGYGKTWSGGGIRCTSAVNGLTCRNKEGHGFFLSRESWRRF